MCKNNNDVTLSQNVDKENKYEIELLDIEKKYYIPQLYYKTHDDLWRNGNQQSTYELVIYVRRKLTNNTSSQTTEIDYQWIQHIYDIIRTHPKKYGKLALNDNWCHHFTDEQLQNFYDLVENTD